MVYKGQRAAAHSLSMSMPSRSSRGSTSPELESACVAHAHVRVSLRASERASERACVRVSLERHRVSGVACLSALSRRGFRRTFHDRWPLYDRCPLCDRCPLSERRASVVWSISARSATSADRSDLSSRDVAKAAYPRVRAQLRAHMRMAAQAGRGRRRRRPGGGGDCMTSDSQRCHRCDRESHSPILAAAACTVPRATTLPSSRSAAAVLCIAIVVRRTTDGRAQHVCVRVRRGLAGLADRISSDRCVASTGGKNGPCSSAGATERRTCRALA